MNGNNKSSDPAFVPGDVIQSSEPIVHIIHPEHRGAFCDNCLTDNNTTELKRCTRCKFTSYCNKQCQQEDWDKFHKHHECSIYKKVQKDSNFLLTSSISQLLLRTYLAMKHRPGLWDKEFTVFDRSTISFNHLPTHSDRLEDSMRLAFFHSLSNYLTSLLPDLDTDLLLQCHVRLLPNRMDVLHKSVLAIASAVYPTTCAIPHSCTPNTCIRYTGVKQEIRAITHIMCPKHVTISKVDISLSRSIRQKTLSQEFGIDCKCERCMTNVKGDELWHESTKLELELQDLLTQLEQNPTSASGIEESMFQKINRIVELRGSLHAEYNPIKSVWLFRCLHRIYLTRDQNWNKSKVNSLIQLVEKALIVTHGKDDWMFHELQNMKTAMTSS